MEARPAHDFLAEHSQRIVALDLELFENDGQPFSRLFGPDCMETPGIENAKALHRRQGQRRHDGAGRRPPGEGRPQPLRVFRTEFLKRDGGDAGAGQRPLELGPGRCPDERTTFGVGTQKHPHRRSLSVQGDHGVGTCAGRCGSATGEERLSRRQAAWCQQLSRLHLIFV